MQRVGTALLILLASGTAAANMPPPTPEAEAAPPPEVVLPKKTLVERIAACDSVVCLPGRWLFQYTRMDPFTTDAEGHESAVRDAGRQLIRLHPVWNINHGEGLGLQLHGEIDLLTGRTFGDLNTVIPSDLYDPDDRRDAWAAPDVGDYRQLYLSWRSAIGLLRIGQQTSSWGLGVIANDGHDEAHDLFDTPRAGDIAERVLFATAPLGFMQGDWAQKLLLVGGFDVVYRDENANLVDGDLALGGLVSLIWRDMPGLGAVPAERSWGVEAGVYVAFRDQEDADGDTLDARAYDLFARVHWDLPGEDLRLTAAAELVILDGETSRVALEQAPGGVDILALGAALQTSLRSTALGLEARFEAGYASGDNDRGDGVSRAFTFDPDYHVGMILFQEVMGRISAQASLNARDPALLERPSKGTELIASDGAIQNAWYLYPALRWDSPYGLGVDLAMVIAWSDADFTDPWQSALHGGYNTNYLGRASGSHFLGAEMDAGLRYEVALGNRVWAKVLLQGGVFLPGHAFDAPGAPGPSLGTVYKLRTGVELGW